MADPFAEQRAARRAGMPEGRPAPSRSRPVNRREAHDAGAKSLGHGEECSHPHHSADGYRPRECLGVDRVHDQPVDRSFEAAFRARLERLRASRRPDQSPSLPGP